MFIGYPGLLRLLHRYRLRAEVLSAALAEVGGTLHLPGGVAEEIAVVFGQEGFNGGAAVAQAEVGAVARVAAGVVRPGQDDVAQRAQRGLELLW